MSQLCVRVCSVTEKQPIPNSDRIEHVRVGNWWVVCKKDLFQINEKVLYVPPEVVVPKTVAEKWGISTYCATLPKKYVKEVRDGLRIKASRFRGAPSFGTIQKLDNPDWEIGKNLAEHYDITKYNPLLSCEDDDVGDHNPLFTSYSSIEHLGNFSDAISENENVIVTEKIHGMNSRIGFVIDPNFDTKTWNLIVGSHDVPRSEFRKNGQRSRYWSPLSVDADNCNIRKLLEVLAKELEPEYSIILYGEIYGYGIQDMHYGTSKPDYVGFDISIDGKFLEYATICSYFDRFGIKTPPLIYSGPFSLNKMDQLVDGPTLMCPQDKIKEPFKGREGIVIKPEKEKISVEINGRTILKYVSVDYYDRKNSNKSEFH